MAKPPLAAPGQLELVRPPAPGRLELVRNFLNTRNIEQGTDAIATPAELLTWLRENDLVERKGKLSLAASDVEYVRGIREDVRALTQRNNGADSACLTAGLEAASERSRYALQLDPATNTCLLRPTTGGVDGALGQILAAVAFAMLDRSWARLKSCADESCLWTYFDHSKNGCSRWCSAETCGNRSKVKRYRERQAQQNA